MKHAKQIRLFGEIDGILLEAEPNGIGLGVFIDINGMRYKVICETNGNMISHYITRTGLADVVENQLPIDISESCKCVSGELE